jgi:ABC-type nitrate/sulfonate/bicarbonate transport system ATPase subunit
MQEKKRVGDHLMSQNLNRDKDSRYETTHLIKSLRSFFAWFALLPSSIKRMFLATCLVGLVTFSVEVFFIRFLNALMADIGLIQGETVVVGVRVTGLILILLAIMRLVIGVFRFFLSGKLAQTWTHLQREGLVRRAIQTKNPITADEIQKYSYHAESGGQFFIVLGMLFFNSVSALATGVYCFWLSPKLSLLVIGVSIVFVFPALAGLKILRRGVNSVFSSKQIMDRYYVSMIENSYVLGAVESKKIIDKNISESHKFAQGMVKIDLIKGIKRNFPELIGICIVIVLITNYRKFADISVVQLTTMVYLLVRLSQYIGSGLYALGQSQLLHKSIEMNNQIELAYAAEIISPEQQKVRANAESLQVEIIRKDGMTFSITSPGFVHLAGVSGAGKTTLLRQILGAPSDDRYAIKINGEDSRYFAGQIAYAGITPFIYPGSLLDNIFVFGPSTSQLDDELSQTIQNVFPEIAIDRILEILPSQLSTGQLQRLSFLQLLVSKRKILLIDEAFSSLGSQELSLIKKLKINSPDSLIIFVSHNVELGTLGDQVIELNSLP